MQFRKQILEGKKKIALMSMLILVSGCIKGNTMWLLDQPFDEAIAYLQQVDESRLCALSRRNNKLIKEKVQYTMKLRGLSSLKCSYEYRACKRYGISEENDSFRSCVNQERRINQLEYEIESARIEARRAQDTANAARRDADDAYSRTMPH